MDMYACHCMIFSNCDSSQYAFPRSDKNSFRIVILKSFSLIGHAIGYTVLNLSVSPFNKNEGKYLLCSSIFFIEEVKEHYKEDEMHTKTNS